MPDTQKQISPDIITLLGQARVSPLYGAIIQIVSVQEDTKHISLYVYLRY